MGCRGRVDRVPPLYELQLPKTAADQQAIAETFRPYLDARDGVSVNRGKVVTFDKPRQRSADADPHGRCSSGTCTEVLASTHDDAPESQGTRKLLVPGRTRRVPSL